MALVLIFVLSSIICEQIVIDWFNQWGTSYRADFDCLCRSATMLLWMGAAGSAIIKLIINYVMISAVLDDLGSFTGWEL